MTTTVEAVQRYVETDLAFHKALNRGFLNVRRAARWLIETQEWDTTEEAVVSALRRYDPPSSHDLDAALHLLKHINVTARTGLVSLSIPGVREDLLRIRDIAAALEPEDTFGLLPERKRVVVLIDADKVDLVKSRLRPSQEWETETHLAEIQLRLPEKGEVASTAVSVVLNVLGHRGVSVEGTFGTLPIVSILVDEDDFVKAHKVATDFTSEGNTPKPGGMDSD